MTIHSSVLGLIADTPIVKAQRLDTGLCEIYFKLESQNPGGSIKDRIGLEMIEAAEARGDLIAVLVQPLRGDPQVDAARAVGHGEPRLRPEERLVLHADLVGALDDDVARRRGVAVGEADVADHVAVGMDRWRVGGCLGVDQRGQHLVGDGDRVERPAGRVRVVGGYRGHRFAGEAHDVAGEHRLVGREQAVGAGSRHVVGGDDARHAGDRQRRPDVERGDAGVGVGRAQGAAPQHALGVQVGGEGEATLHLGGAVGADRAVADAAAAAAAGRSAPYGRGRLDVGHAGVPRVDVAFPFVIAAATRRVTTRSTAARMRP